MGQQFDEATIAGMSDVEKALHEQRQADHVQFTQFAERQAVKDKAHNQAVLFAKIKTSDIPPGMKTKMLSQAGSVQFDEDGGEQTRYTASEVIDLFAEFIPKHLQFDASETKEAKAPEHVTAKNPEDKGGLHVDAERAKEISDSNNTQWEAPRMNYENPNGPSAGVGQAAAKEPAIAGWE